MSGNTLYNLLQHNLIAGPDKTAVIAGETCITYRQLSRQAESLSAWLWERGVRSGEMIGIHLRKCVEEITATFAAARIGAAFVNINSLWTVRQLEHVIDDCGVRILFTDTLRAMALAKSGLIEKLDTIVVADRPPNHDKVISWASVPGDLAAPLVNVEENDLAALIYTSGSTGSPMGVMHSHSNLVQGAKNISSYLKNLPQDRVLGLLPMSSTYGLSQVTTMFLVGGAIVLQPVAIADEIVKTIIAKKVTGFAAAPPTWIQMIQYLQQGGMSPSSLRYITSSGSSIPRPFLELLPQVLPGVEIYSMYGLTETLRSTYLRPELFSEKLGSIGRAIPNVEVYVVDSEKGICGPGEQGQLIHRGDTICQGYWANTEATAEIIKPCEHLKPLIGNEKVLHTGDTVRIDKDEYLWFVGRSDSMIKCGGYRVNPEEVEKIVYESGLVGSVVAFDIADEILGRVFHIAVTAPDDKAPNIMELLTFCRRNMPGYMVPRRIHSLSEPMPRTTSQKIDRRGVIRMCEGESRRLA